MTDKNCHEVHPSEAELCVVQCNGCGFHLGLDATYLEQVAAISMDCPGCGLGLYIGDGSMSEADEAKLHAFIDKKIGPR